MTLWWDSILSCSNCEVGVLSISSLISSVFWLKATKQNNQQTVLKAIILDNSYNRNILIGHHLCAGFSYAYAWALHSVIPILQNWPENNESESNRFWHDTIIERGPLWFLIRVSHFMSHSALRWIFELVKSKLQRTSINNLTGFIYKRVGNKYQSALIVDCNIISGRNFFVIHIDVKHL